MPIVTTSWDDGNILDKKLARILNTYGLKGTFYVVQKRLGNEHAQGQLTVDDIRTLSERHEIGAHTITHPDLTSITSPLIMESEIAGSKKWLEGICQRPIEMFCYPRGRYNEKIEMAVKAAGFIGARTVRQFSIIPPTSSVSTNLTTMDTTIQVYPFPFRWRSARWPYWRRLLDPIHERSSGIRSLGLPISAYFSFESLAKAAFDKALASDGVFHVWGHSWEIEKYAMWPQLERVCAYIAGRLECQYLTNGDILKNSDVIKKIHG